MAQRVDPPNPPHPNDWGPRQFSTTGYSAYRLTVERAGIVFDFTRLRREREGLIGELIVRCDFAGARTINGILSAGDLNISSIQARGTRAKHLAARALAHDVDWEGYITELALSVLEAERSGADVNFIGDIPVEPNGGEHAVLGISIERRASTILFGHGGSAKSMFALYAAGDLAKAGELVLYADWEANGSDHRQRLDLLYPPSFGTPAILYHRCERPLVHEADRIRALVAEHGVTFVVADSAAYGCVGAPETADAALGYFKALRTLGNVGSLILAHQTKSEDGDRAPYGTAFWHNSARATWHVRRSNPDTDGEDVHLLFTHRKANNGRLRPARSICLTFGQERIMIAATSAADVPEFVPSLTLGQRIGSALKRRALTQAQLALELPDTNAEVLRKTITRELERGRLIRMMDKDGGPDLIGLKHA